MKIASLPVGTDPVTASYPGDANNAADPETLMQVVQANSDSANLRQMQLTVMPIVSNLSGQAISAAINRSLLASEGEAGLENPVLNATGLTLPTFSAWSAPVANMTVSATGSAAAAKQILQKAGYTMGSNGFFSKGGKEVTLSIIDPSAYTDYAQVDAIVAQELRAAGINATQERS